MEQIFTELTLWHWLAIGLLLFGIEMMTGTFDLLMISIAAWLTAAFTYFGPESMVAWQGQLVFFGIAAFALVLLGRTVLSGFRKSTDEHPTLNRRMQSLIGQSGLATGDFSASGSGQIRVGDTVWGAQAAEGQGTIRAGDAIIVEGARMTTAIVRRV